MFTLFGKKKMAIETVANIFTNRMLTSMEEGFDDFISLVSFAPEFEDRPQLDASFFKHFFYIVLGGNLKLFPSNIDSAYSKAIKNEVIEQFAKIYNTYPEQLDKKLVEYQKFMSLKNRPSKNILYGMSKGVFYKFELYKYQTNYFKNLKQPNPLLLKRLDEAMSAFIWDWNSFEKNYKIIEQ